MENKFQKSQMVATCFRAGENWGILPKVTYRVPKLQSIMLKNFCLGACYCQADSKNYLYNNKYFQLAPSEILGQNPKSFQHFSKGNIK